MFPWGKRRLWEVQTKNRALPLATVGNGSVNSPLASGSSSVKWVSAMVNTGKALARCETWPKTNADRRLQCCGSYLSVTKASNTAQTCRPQWQLAWLHHEGRDLPHEDVCSFLKLELGTETPPD